MRLIDADALKDGLFIKFGNQLPNGLIGEINNAPTVKRSQCEWIVNENDDIFNSKKCSVCNKEAEWLDGGSQFLSNFCPNCGAKMRGII